jgi:RecA/RadA recombinase
MPRKQQNKLVDQVVDHNHSEESAVESGGLLLIPTGSTLLNLAASDNAFGGWGAGKVINLVGDSNTGKTLLALTGLMEMAMDKKFDDWKLIYDDAENALEMPVADMFGKALANRIEDPYGHLWGDEDFRSSETIEDVRNNIWKLLDDEVPFFYILDSYDATTNREEIKRQQEETKGKEKSRDFPRGPGVLSETLRKIKSRLKNTQSNFMVISQTRDNIDAVSFAATKRRAGGRALKFYSSHEVWLAVGKGGQITKEVKGSKYIIGWNIRVRSERSKLNGKRRDVPMVCFTSYGVDDISANIEWLLEHKIWTGSRSAIFTKGFCNTTLGKQQLIEWIEEKRKETKLRKVMQQAWDGIEDALHIDRRRRFE